MRRLEASDLLALWERGAPRHALDRSALLCAWARPDVPADAVADLPLGTVTAALLRLRTETFGARIRAHVDCERCGERLELNLAAGELLQPVDDDAVAPREIEVGGLRVRAPSLRDLAAVSRERDAEHAARLILERCMRHDGRADVVLPEAGLRQVEDALEAIDPNADLAFDVRCAVCGHEGCAQLDAGELLWDEIDARARALLGEVHLLARAYGWTEGEVLGLSGARRAAYLAMVAA
ncbi:MAG: hypothetical protein JSR59_05255 [Proteobacteria bacterium]|nr:hypothetical protein [Pseudomonadota bacterium]